MKWILNNPGSNNADFQLACEDGNIVVFKFSQGQQTIRMRCNDHHGVFVLDEGSFRTKKISILNIYGSEIGVLMKSQVRETSGYVLLEEFPEKINYFISLKKSLVELSDSTIIIDVKREDAEISKTYMLSLIVFAWFQAVTTNKAAAIN